MPTETEDDDKIIVPDLSCSGCGACCRHMQRPPFIRIEDPFWERLKAEQPELVAEIEADMEANPWDYEANCLWYDAVTNQCKHYDYRPEICRDFTPGSGPCLDHRAVYGITPPQTKTKECLHGSHQTI